jgi:hypothetical protein
MDARTARERVKVAWPEADAAPLATREAAALVTPLPIATLNTAVATWSIGVFGLCYVAIPWLLSLLGIVGDGLSHVATDMVGAAITVLPALLLVAIGRPSVRAADVSRAATIAATASGFAVWAALHNTLPGLARFNELGVVGLPVFVAVNLLESALWGVMIGSVSRGIGKAFVFGGLFSGSLMITMWTLWTLVDVVNTFVLTPMQP